MYFSNTFILLITLLFTMLTLNVVTALPLHRRASYSGDGTFYTVGLGSCGKTNSDSEMVAALSSSLMSGGKNCGKSLKVTSDSGSVTVKAVDTCPSCAEGDVDFSPAAFKKLGSLDEGRISINWSFT
ncbi:RlpA-like double-psi beta-barrel-protein domain-containing protein-containing protein [Phascolomyces articulosus]|uniref:RlpA-like double-psi beta-barrel-protein domain-containing protein-containing protein n=1 Tax=Phascolomyces articulosus TaxID=60185 RepID=A0AAD5PDD5_9FUNG|nr:RlpA-like double-psi beta-barrel-protein domain-containing protein-containing protein [Phascolomyces articulosus]